MIIGKHDCKPASTETVPNVDDLAPPRVRDAVIGLVILAVWTGSCPYAAVLLFGRPVPVWVNIAGFVVGPTLFLLLYPFWVVHSSGASPLMRWRGGRAMLYEALIGIGAGIATVVGLTSAEFVLFGKPLDLPEPLRQLITARNALVTVVVSVLALTVVPIAEEAFFRGLIYGSLRRWNVVGALIVQALLFALLHWYNFTYSVFVFVGGIILALLYEWRRTLLTPIFAHWTCAVITVIALAIAFIDYGDAPVLGVALDNHEEGCRITTVLPQSSAEEAGLRAGDIVISLGSQPTSHPRALVRVLEQHAVGDKVTVKVIRDDTLIVVNVTLKHRRR